MLKDDIFKLQTKYNELENQSKNIKNDLERAELQITVLNKSNNSLVKDIQILKVSYQEKENKPSFNQQNYYKSNLNSKAKNSDLQHEKHDDSHKKIQKLEK